MSTHNISRRYSHAPAGVTGRNIDKVPEKSSKNEPHPPDAPLTRNEEQTVVLLAAGLTDKEIAAKLGVTEDGVGWRLRRLFEKLGVHSRTALLARVFGWRRDITWQDP